MSVEEIMSSGKDKMEKAIGQLKKEFATVRTGRANPLILDKITVDYYGAPTPLRQMAQVTVQDGTTLVIAPFDKSILKEIEKAVIKADLGITPNSDGIVVRLPFPPLTSDKRKEIAKDVKKLGEEAKVAVRNIRRDMTDDIKKAEKAENLSEDVVKDKQNEIQKLTDKYTKTIEELCAEKEKEVLTI
ncbi:MAG: ribosome recycling factor [Candidatus Gastranaerophilaceae bacterium]